MLSNKNEVFIMNKPEPIVDHQQFPSDFIWGVATSAFQIEGAAHTDGKGESIWDRFCQQPGVIADGSDGLHACEHYTRWPQDLDLIAGLGVDAYRFSVCWPRVQPDGSGAWNRAGLEFYDRLVDGMLERGLQPHMTLNHWDLPQALQDQGGWAHRATIDHFVRYAERMAALLGDRVHSIATHNEPWVMAVLGHETGIFAPGIKDRKVAAQVAHHLLVSHGQAVQALRAQGCKARLGIVLNLAPIHAASDQPSDTALAQLEDGKLVRWYMDALFRGYYPADVLADLGDQVPTVLDGDMAATSTSIDFLGINYYTRSVTRAGTPWQPGASGLPLTDMGWEIYPQGLTELLLRLRRDYPLPPVLITENGAAFADELRDGQVHDQDRIDYLASHIDAVRQAMAAGVPVAGYMVWSLLDNFEWASGYQKRFGIVHVDYATQQRTLKASAQWYRHFLQQQRLLREVGAAVTQGD